MKVRGGQRYNWWKFGLKYYWNDVIQKRIPEFKETLFDENDKKHIVALETAAKN